VFRTILFVCEGNICRSPTAAVLLRDALGDSATEAASAGLRALVGKPIDATAQQLLLDHGLDGSAHRARQASAALLRAADLILAMERRQVHAIARAAPEVSGKVFVLSHWHDRQDIPDPYRQPQTVFAQVYAQIARGVASWRPYLR
jgi:protein-tyrosine phosphatase